MPLEDLVSQLHAVLLDLNAHPYPEVANPPEAPKRASVALILRIQPHYSHWSDHPPPPGPTQFRDSLEAFFAQDWVKHGDPELLFIKRATRAGDKWNGHVALPGGKRDPEDGDDQVTAAREALEEVGIRLDDTNSIPIGNLPQRLVTTSWGKVPLMVLCPYIYLLTSPAYPSQRLQPTEVASTHWVSLRALQAPSLRTYEYADVSARLAKSEFGITRWFLQTMLSKMMFAAIHLVPSSSIYCSTIPGFLPEGPPPDSGLTGRIKEALAGPENIYARPPLLLWGLTLGVVSDLLEHLPPHNALELWTYPTFTNWDVRFVMWAMSYRFRKQKSIEMRTQTTVGLDTVTVPIVDPEVAEKPGEVGIAGLGVGRDWGRAGRAKMVARNAAVNSMLEGYYPIVRRAVATALMARISLALGLAAWLGTKYRVKDCIVELWRSLYV
ncbi:hypothetical protein BU23DRAFT_538476 [Bimuria novae-zelandiae CBS 107.79]|uniref:Nudix hydrolase domain-containing protein n=1 Tax=Bimuria novae-zelandiae CBS 107.79 TaxID=1447943 RepID=A0A6A5VA38_9PLEO|nr:hypothetical protein BU23DRAFT_538476 [Bimuria novae-zelandiae CBS 107.79]